MVGADSFESILHVPFRSTHWPSPYSRVELWPPQGVDVLSLLTNVPILPSFVPQPSEFVSIISKHKMVITRL
jgi:hypothetical protein